jgi:hypothetical protein
MRTIIVNKTVFTLRDKWILLVLERGRGCVVFGYFRKVICFLLVSSSLRKFGGREEELG